MWNTIINFLKIVMIVITIIYWMFLLSIADSLSMAGALGGFLLGAILILMCVYDPNKNEDEKCFLTTACMRYMRKNLMIIVTN